MYFHTYTCVCIHVFMSVCIYMCTCIYVYLYIVCARSCLSVLFWPSTDSIFLAAR